MVGVTTKGLGIGSSSTAQKSFEVVVADVVEEIVSLVSVEEVDWERVIL